MLAPSRVLGLGGAYAGYAEDAEGTYANTAAAAVRSPFSLSHIDQQVSGSLLQPGFFSSVDFENRGSLGNRASSVLNVGLYGMLQIGRFGASLSTDLVNFRVSDVSLRLLLARATVAYGFFDGQLAIGVGARGAIMQIQQDDAPGAPSGSLLFTGSASPEIGVLVRKDDEPWRIGVTARAPVIAPLGARTAAGLILPRELVLPAEIEAGVSLQVGARPLNPKWLEPAEQEAPARAAIEAARAARREENARALARDPSLRATLAREEEAIRRVEDKNLRREIDRLYDVRLARSLNWPRSRLLVVAGVLVTIPHGGSVSVSDFLNQERVPYGADWTLSPRFGLEGEPVPDWLTVRLGGYLEPARFATSEPRQHVTFGADLKLFPLDFIPLFHHVTLKLSSSFDFAPRYSNWGIGLGVWH